MYSDNTNSWRGGGLMPQATANLPAHERPGRGPARIRCTPARRRALIGPVPQRLRIQIQQRADMPPGTPASTRPAPQAVPDTSGPPAHGTPGRTSSVLSCAESSCVGLAPGISRTVQELAFASGLVGLGFTMVIVDDLAWSYFRTFPPRANPRLIWTRPTNNPSRACLRFPTVGLPLQPIRRYLGPIWSTGPFVDALDTGPRYDPPAGARAV
jgi:hypothetical protein